MTRLATVVVAVALGLLFQGCGSNNHILHLQSEPAGAEVYLKRSGTSRFEGSSPLGKARVSGEKFEEEEFRLIGITPCEYEFPPEVKHQQHGVAGMGGMREYRRFLQGTLQFKLPGHKVEERNVPFNKRGEPILVSVPLTKE